MITDDVPMGTSAADAAGHIRLLMLVNDVSLRNLIPAELAKGFGFFQSKPASAFSPVAVTPDELGGAWHDGKVHLPLVSHLNGRLFGRPNAGVDMTFDFRTLIAHVARTRELVAGSIVGSGTVSNKENGGPGRPAAAGGVGYSCIAEQRTVETLGRRQGRRRRSCASATASGSKCTTRAAVRSSARSTRRCGLRSDGQRSASRQPPDLARRRRRRPMSRIQRAYAPGSSPPDALGAAFPRLRRIAS